LAGLADFIPSVTGSGNGFVTMHELLYSLWFFLPAGIANPTPIVVAKLPLIKHWNAPLDFGRSYRGQRIFGDSKTWRGLICGVVAGLAIFAVQQKLAAHLGGFSTYLQAKNYSNLPFILGLLLGAGALLGDAVESFFKRQRGIAPSGGWFPFDQLDYIIGACLLSLPVAVLPLALYALILVNWFVLHLVFSHIGVLLHLKT
jgi:CDP-2,3-bis-(O-geranylgeranyl)-sn-glycerol synthase